MDIENEHQAGSKQPDIRLQFCQRFDIQLDLAEAQQHFLNRIVDEMDGYVWSMGSRGVGAMETVLRGVANTLGSRYEPNSNFSDYVKGNFPDCLRALEAVYEALCYSSHRTFLDSVVKEAIIMSETDLGITWRDGKFEKSGAKLLDDQLVNEPLKWLDDPKYRDVLTPFRKGVAEFLEVNTNPAQMGHVARDMYEALGEMARVVLGNRRNLKANALPFVRKLGLSNLYRKMLREYVNYADKFQYAVAEDGEQVVLQIQEVEAFVYTTGIFLRLAVKVLAEEA